MKIDDLLNTLSEPQTGEDWRKLFSTLLTADDLTSDEHGAMLAGYIMGICFAMVSEKDAAAIELMLRTRELNEL